MKSTTQKDLKKWHYSIRGAVFVESIVLNQISLTWNWCAQIERQIRLSRATPGGWDSSARLWTRWTKEAGRIRIISTEALINGFWRNEISFANSLLVLVWCTCVVFSLPKSDSSMFLRRWNRGWHSYLTESVYKVVLQKSIHPAGIDFWKTTL